MRISPNGNWLVYTFARAVLAERYPRPGNAPIVIDTKVGVPFFSRDGSTLYRTDGLGLIAQSVIASDQVGFRLGEPKTLFPLLRSLSAGAQVAAASRDGARILAITTDQPEAVGTQIASDWTVFLDRAVASK